MAPERESAAEVAAKLRDRDRRTLARTISALERGGENATAILGAVKALGAEPAWTIGITGPPGAGKSTLVDQLIAHLRDSGDQVAVCAVDPTSPETGGSILGDRVRLRADHVVDDGVYMRSLAAKHSLGGLSDVIPGAIAALELAGWPEVILETVGVGQSEVDVARQADTTIVVLTPESGDDIQASKAGLLEVADIVVINKADRPGATQMATSLHIALSGSRDAWSVPVLQVVAADGQGVAELLEAVRDHRAYLEESGMRYVRQRRRRRSELERHLTKAIEARVSQLLQSEEGQELLRELDEGRRTPAEVTQRLFEDRQANHAS